MREDEKKLYKTILIFLFNAKTIQVINYQDSYNNFLLKSI